VRYTKVSGIGSVTYKLQAWNAAGTKVADVSDTQTLLGTGPYTVTFPTPVAIAAGETWTFSYSTPANNVPVGPSGSAVTNTADVTFIEYRYNFTADTYPNGVTTNACYVEPIFEAVNTWLGSDGDSTDNYLLVNETGVPNVSNNVTDSTSGRQDMYTLTDLVRSGTVIGVCHSTYAAKSDSGSIQFKLVNRRSADNKSGAISPTTAYVGYQYVLENDPETSAAWTVANVNALQSGVEVV
jgi:hypothetical protein